MRQTHISYISQQVSILQLPVAKLQHFVGMISPHQQLRFPLWATRAMNYRPLFKVPVLIMSSKGKGVA